MSEDFRNRREDFKTRWKTLVLRTTGDAKLADKIFRDMLTDEIEAKIDAQGRK